MSSKVLVSGATGFIAGHIIKQLLDAGHHVRGTVRNPDNAASVGFLKALPGAERLELVAADLNAPGAFDAYTGDIDYVLHTASPYVLDAKDAQRDLVDPAVRGTLSMLEAAAKSPLVKRVVLTSSMAAVTDEPDGRVLTEADWNVKSSLTRNPYYFSKAEAERAAWKFMDERKLGFDLIVINPFMVIGPALSPAINTSNQIFVDMAKGAYPAIMAIEWGFVDVRDVAQAHIAAMTAPTANGRYICAAGNLDMGDVAALLRDTGVKGKIPTLNLSGGFGTAMMKLASRFQPQGVGSYLRTHLGRIPRFDNSKIRNDLGITFRDPESSIRDTAADLIRWGHVQGVKM
jgi:dihydroflavonol-4-reductase